MDEENDLVVDFFPGATNTDLLKETLDDLLPCKSYVLDTIKGTAAKFKADFYISSSTEAEAAKFRGVILSTNEGGATVSNQQTTGTKKPVLILQEISVSSQNTSYAC